MEMPNTVPNALNQGFLADKYDIAARTSLANYSFYMGASNDNIEEVLKTNIHNVCGIKVFMGSSTGNMLVDNEKTLENIFSKSPMLIATHCGMRLQFGQILKFTNNVLAIIHIHGFTPKSETLRLVTNLLRWQLSWQNGIMHVCTFFTLPRAKKRIYSVTIFH